MAKYLMLDRRLLNPQVMKNIRLVVESPVKDEIDNPLFTEEKPWKVRIDNGYPNVLYDREAEIYHCYYMLSIEDEDSRKVDRRERVARDYIPRPDRAPGLAYAESVDGIHWVRPCLSRVGWQRSKESNLIFAFAHGTGVMIDEWETDAACRYKMVTETDQSGEGAYMAVSFSPDSVDWEVPILWLEHSPPVDSHNLPFFDEQENCYMLLLRIWKDGIRITTLSKSKDFLHWSEPEETLRGIGSENQIYAMPVFRWEDLYLRLTSVIHERDRTSESFDQVDLELAQAAEPERFDFAIAGQHLIPRGRGSYPDGTLDCRCICALPPAMTPEGEMWVYYMGGNDCHINFHESSLARAKWQPDKFITPTPRRVYQDSMLTTSRLQVGGGTLEPLAESADEDEGWIPEAEMSPFWNSEPFDGFSYGDSCYEQLDNGWISIRFEKGLEVLAGEKASLKLQFRNLKIWVVQGDVVQVEYRPWEGTEQII